MRVLMEMRLWGQAAQRYMSCHGREVTNATTGLECVAILRCDVTDVVVLKRDLLWGRRP